MDVGLGSSSKGWIVDCTLHRFEPTCGPAPGSIVLNNELDAMPHEGSQLR